MTVHDVPLRSLKTSNVSTDGSIRLLNMKQIRVRHETPGDAFGATDLMP